MKKIISITVALFLMLSSNLFAQDSEPVTVTANVLAALNITVNQHVVFGNIQPGDATLDRESADETDPDGTNIGSTAQLGKVTITASNSTNVLVSFNNAVLSDNEVTATTIPFTTLVRDITNGVNINTGATVSTSAGGELILHIGGNLDWTGRGGASATSGTFATNTGGTDITVEVQYL